MRVIKHSLFEGAFLNAFMKGGICKMAKIYFSLIKKGYKTIDDVPEKIRAEVEALLASDEG